MGFIQSAIVLLVLVIDVENVPEAIVKHVTVIFAQYFPVKSAQLIIRISATVKNVIAIIVPT